MGMAVVFIMFTVEWVELTASAQVHTGGFNEKSVAYDILIRSNRWREYLDKSELQRDTYRPVATGACT